MGPKGIPRPIVARWQAIVKEALESREMKERFDADGLAWLRRRPGLLLVPVAVIGQAFPYTPIANPAHFVPDWSFGIQD